MHLSQKKKIYIGAKCWLLSQSTRLSILKPPFLQIKTNIKIVITCFNAYKCAHQKGTAFSSENNIGVTTLAHRNPFRT